MLKFNTPRTLVALAATLTTTLAAVPAAQAQTEGPWLVRVRAVNIDTANKDTIPGVDVDVSNKVIPEVDFTYFYTPNLAAELILTVPQKHDISAGLEGGAKADIGSLKHLPPTFTLQYHFAPNDKFRPYVGAGINYTRFSSVDLPAGYSIDKDSFGAALQAGVDIEIGKGMYLNLDIKKVYIRTDLSIDGVKAGTIKVDPILFGVGIGWRF